MASFLSLAIWSIKISHERLNDNASDGQQWRKTCRFRLAFRAEAGYISGVLIFPQFFSGRGCPAPNPGNMTLHFACIGILLVALCNG
jgi:hypothetical protein